MSITEDIINQEVVALVEEVIGCCFEITGDNATGEHWRIMTLGEISGIVDMAKAMKEVLRK